MCGIGGVLTSNPPTAAELENYSECFASRGPDNYGYDSSGSVAFCHRRLSIIDLDPRSHQPLWYEHLMITFNGEIYNFLELKDELSLKGYSFSTNSDTEVILGCYLAYGIEATLKKVRGMFAFAIYDKREEIVYLARDVYGQKPLYFGSGSDKFAFGSDIRFVAKQLPSLTIDHDSLDFYFQELAMPQPQTIWKEVKQLPKAHYATIDVKSRQLKLANYHQFSFREKQMSWEQAVKGTEQRLIQGILRRTIADVPIACFLSGGIDSGLVVSLLAQNSSDKVNTFSVGFNEDDFNELPYAKKLAERYQTNHTELLVEPNIQDEIYGILSNLGEPFGDSSLIPSFIVTREMTKHYKVALSGDGGDELFGYPWYAEMYEIERFLRTNPSRTKVAVSKLTSRLGLGKNLGSMGAYINEPPTGDVLNRSMVFSKNETCQLFKGREANFTSSYLNEAWNATDASTYSNKLIAGSLTSRLLNDYLVKVDRASMMNSLEIRSPFLDLDLGEYAFSIPNELKFQNFSPKAILKELARKHVAKDIDSRKKSGFGIPINHWFKAELKELLTDQLSESNLGRHGLFDNQFVQTTIHDHLTGKKDNRHKLWCLLSFQIWYDQNA